MSACAPRCGSLPASIPASRTCRLSRSGSKGVADDGGVREVVLVEPGAVMRIVDAVYKQDAALGLLVHVLAETGCRTSQALRLECQHLQIGQVNSLRMPGSFKGKSNGKGHHYEPAPISAELAARLVRAREGRADNARLLLTTGDLRDVFRAAVERIGFDPERFTPYCLRHTSIVSQLRVLPPINVAKLHNTSVKEIEAHYGKYCNRDDRVLQLAMSALPQRATANVVRLRRA